MRAGGGVWYKGTEDIPFWDLYDQGRWEPETKEVLERFLTPGSMFLDIGAWIGPVSLWALELGAEVIALEPDPEAFAHLTHNTHGQDIKCLQAALAAKTGIGYLAPFEERSWGDSQSRLSDTGLMVITIAPEVLLKFGGPDLIKLDIEGGECAVLPELLSWHRPIYLSWHEPWWPKPIDYDTRLSWFNGYDLKPIRGDGWTGFSELLAVPCNV